MIDNKFQDCDVNQSTRIYPLTSLLAAAERWMGDVVTDQDNSIIGDISPFMELHLFSHSLLYYTCIVRCVGLMYEYKGERMANHKRWIERGYKTFFRLRPYWYSAART